METGKSTIRSVFDGSKIFNIPIYQRAYSWDPDTHLVYFLSDLIDQPNDTKRPYFLGSFLFHRKGFQGDFQIIDVVDGQQRLTTFIIFVKALIDEFNKRKSVKVSDRTNRTYIRDGDVYKLKLSNEDSSFLHEYILGDALMEGIETKTPSQRLLLDARLFFKEQLAELSTETLEHIYDISTSAEVLIYVVDELYAATQIFELLNDRGKRLTDLEAIKSFLMYTLGRVSDHPEQLILNVQNNFAEMYREIEKYDLEEADVLRYHTIAFEGDYETKPKAFIKSKIAALLKAEKKEECKQVVQQYAKNLQRSFTLFRDLYWNTNKLAQLDRFHMLGRTASFYPALMKIKRDSPDQLPEALESIAKFTFKAGLVGLRSNGESTINSVIKNNGDVLSVLKKMIDDNWWNVNERAAQFADYRNYFEWINKNIVKYILFSYENNLRGDRFPHLTYADYVNDDPQKKLNIEHINAQRAKGIVMDEDFVKNYEHHIGNLVIDTTSSNSSKNSKNTADKMDAFKLAPIMSQNEIDNYEVDWRNLESVKLFIDARGKLLRKFILEEFQV